ncbi:MAG: hypothetical protein ACOY5U_13780, partial [Pseudomonadota bacterium]
MRRLTPIPALVASLSLALPVPVFAQDAPAALCADGSQPPCAQGNEPTRKQLKAAEKAAREAEKAAQKAAA